MTAMRQTRVATVLAALLVLAGACASTSAIPAGPYAVGKSQMQVGRTWTDITTFHGGLAKQTKVLSVDGPLLNRLYIVDGLPVGEWLVRAPRKETPTPVLRADMSATERMEFVADNLVVLGYQNVETARPRQARMGDTTGVRFDITARTTEGLNMLGTAVAAEKNARLYLVLYMAPEEHYYAALLPEVENIIASVRPG